VDDNGVWGTLPDWDGATFTCNAYLPLGYIARKHGRGERKVQAEFLTRAKRLVSQGKPFIFVGQIDGVDETSCNAVDSITADGKQITQTFFLTISRRGLSKTEERDTVEASKGTQRVASMIVDKAATGTGISIVQARRWCLYGPYNRAQQHIEGSHSHDVTCKGDTPPPPEPTSAAIDVLIKQVGTLPIGNESAALNLLRVSESERDDRSTYRAFFDELAALCRKEYSRISKPIAFSVTGKLCGTPTQRFCPSNGAAQMGDVSVFKSVFTRIGQTQPPSGFAALKITAEGAGKFCLSTSGPKESSDIAQAFLTNALSRARELYASNDPGPAGPAIVSQPDSCAHQSPSQPTLNIGLIGDVANGKSTMIRAITGKRTQSHSSEQQKHGMTIRLGFANASVLLCEHAGVCGLYSFRQDEIPGELDKQPFCACCSGPATVVTRVSFIDCPGHAELMATMLSGSSAFDAVILAAAANTPCPSPQARQHLDALQASGRDFEGRIAIAQTKAELLVRADGTQPGEASSSHKLAAHMSNAREKLRKTLASDAPFFPACAPLGVGLEPLAAWLASVASKEKAGPSKQGQRLFRTLRSFDVNFAGTSATELVGGVLGGSVAGPGSFHRGETLEIRPGLALPANQVTTQISSKASSAFKVCPLRFRVEEIMTGKVSLQAASAGGLVALRTTLDPAFCADDRLIGSVIGLPDTLPPIWGPALFLSDLQALSAASSKQDKVLKRVKKIRIHAGSATVTGRVVRVSYSKGKLEVLLDAPICASRGSRIAIEAKVGSFSGYSLVACGSIADGTICCDGVDSETIADPQSATQENVSSGGEKEWGDEEWVRDRFLQELAGKRQHSQREIVSVPSPSIARDGGAHVLIENFAHIALSLNREPSHLQSYLKKEASLSCARAGEQGSALRVRIRSRGFSELMGRIICRYVSAYVTCRQCRSAKTEFLKNSAAKDQVELLCRQCNARRFVPKIA